VIKIDILVKAEAYIGTWVNLASEFGLPVSTAT